MTTIACGYFPDDQARNHTVSLADVVPDLLLLDIDAQFLLSSEDILYKDDDATLLCTGGYGKVYCAKVKGKSVAIKRYPFQSEDAYAELCWESRVRARLHHPCIVHFIGVCRHPLMALVMEEAPLKSLEFPLLNKNSPVDRLTSYRIAAEVAGGLRFLHSKGIILRSVQAADTLLWTLDPDSLCHCKLVSIGSRGLQGTRRFIAPEVLRIGKQG